MNSLHLPKVIWFANWSFAWKTLLPFCWDGVEMVTFRQAYDIIQQMIEMLYNSEIVFWNWWNIPKNRLPSLHISGHWCQLYPDTWDCSNFGGASHHLRDVGLQSTVCAIQYFGECGCLIFEIKEEQLSFLIDQGFQVLVIAQLFRV